MGNKESRENDRDRADDNSNNQPREIARQTLVDAAREIREIREINRIEKQTGERVTIRDYANRPDVREYVNRAREARETACQERHDPPDHEERTEQASKSDFQRAREQFAWEAKLERDERMLVGEQEWRHEHPEKPQSAPDRIREIERQVKQEREATRIHHATKGLAIGLGAMRRKEEYKEESKRRPTVVNLNEKFPPTSGSPESYQSISTAHPFNPTGNPLLEKLIPIGEFLASPDMGGCPSNLQSVQKHVLRGDMEEER